MVQSKIGGAWQRANRKILAFLAILWVALFLLCMLFPYTGDDWAWGSSIGEDRLNTLFADYNGRWLGNLLVLAVTRSWVLRCVVEASVLTAIVYELYLLAGRQRQSTIVVAAVLIMLVYYRVGAQAIVWASGFTNYAVPALFILVYLVDAKRAIAGPGDPASRASAARCIGMMMLGVTNALFMENITLFNVAIAFLVVLYCRIRYRSWDRAQIAFFLGALIGAVIMFSNGAYWNIAAGEDGYRSVSGEGNSSPAAHLLNIMTFYLGPYAWAVPACILIVTIYRIWAARGTADDTIADKAQDSKRSIVVFAVVLAAVCAVSVYCTFLASTNPGRMRTAFVAFACLALLVALVVHFFLHRHALYGKTGLMLVANIVIIAAPLIIVNPIGPRNFFPTYVIECAVACLIWDTWVHDASKAVFALLCALLAAVMLRWAMVYFAVWSADAARNAIVSEAAEKSEMSIIIEKLPYSGYVHCPDPAEEIWEVRYKLFYGIPESLDIELQ